MFDVRGRPFIFALTIASMSLFAPVSPLQAGELDLSPLSVSTPYYFHTGRFFMRHPVFPDAWTECDPGIEPRGTCLEKVYRFTQTEIDTLVSSFSRELNFQVTTTREQMLSNKINESIILGSSLVATVRYGIVISQNTNFWSKAAFLALLGFDGGYIYMMVRDHKNLSQRLDLVYQTLVGIEDLFREESQYISACGHTRADFLDRAADLGLVFPFYELQGEYIDPTYYFEEKAREDAALKSLGPRPGNSSPYFDDDFLKQCDQLPLTYEAKITQGRIRNDENLKEIFGPLPQFLIRGLIGISNRSLRLQSGLPLEVLNLTESTAQQKSFIGGFSEALTGLQYRLDQIDRSGTSNEKRALERLRSDFQSVKISILPYSQTIGHARRGGILHLKAYQIIDPSTWQGEAAQGRVLVLRGLIKDGRVQLGFEEFFKEYMRQN